MVDWSDANCLISKHFTVKEALWLPQWGVLHIPSDQEKENILAHAKNMDHVRDFLGCALTVHCWIRPVLNNPSSPHHGEDYNALVGGAPKSGHKIGSATDYDPAGMTCDEARAKLEPKLEEFNLRMERRPGSLWVHNDSGVVPPGGHRFFLA